MARYFYIKNQTGVHTGTATGENGVTTTARTGTWNTSTADFYQDMETMENQVTTLPTDGDFVLISHLSDTDYSGIAQDANFINTGISTYGAGVHILSVDNANQENYKKGAYADCSTTDRDFTLKGSGIWAGVDVRTGDNAIHAIGAEGIWQIMDCKITADGSLDVCVRVSGDGKQMHLYDVDLEVGNATADPFYIHNNGIVTWTGGALTGATQPDFLLQSFGVNGGGQLYIDGVDLSLFDGQIYENQQVADDNCIVRLRNCQLNSSVTLYGTLLPHSRFEMFNCDDSTGGGLHRFVVADGSGEATNNDSIYVTANPAFFEGSSKSSIKVTSTSSCTSVLPFRFELPTRYIDLSQSASDLVYINIITEASLTDADISFRMIYPDGTTSVTPRHVKVVDNNSGEAWRNPLGSGTALNTTGALGAGDWTGEGALTTPNYYRVELDTSSVAGSAFAPIIKVEVYTASITLYIDPVLGTA